MSRNKRRGGRVAAAAEELVGTARERAEEAYARAEEAFEHAQEVFEDGLDDAHTYLKRQWRERPVAVAGAALGLGVLVGILLSSGRR